VRKICILNNASAVMIRRCGEMGRYFAIIRGDTGPCPWSTAMKMTIPGT
jgi:hypothetical protein